MSLTARNKEGGTFQLVPEGVHIGVCYLMVDIGEQKKNFKGKEKLVHEVMIGWEFPDELMEDGKPFVITKAYNLSLNERATLRKHLAAWRGRDFTEEELEGFDLRRIVGTACQVQVVHTDAGEKTYANVGGIMALPKGMKSPVPVNAKVIYDLDDPDPSAFSLIPEWIQKKINSAAPAEKAEEATDNYGRGEVEDESSVPF